jgi:hypothetical protein
MTHGEPGVLLLEGDYFGNTVHIYNNGAGHITGDATGVGAFDFFNVHKLEIEMTQPAGGDDGPDSVYYFQQGDAFNRSGDQITNLSVDVQLPSGRTDTFVGTMQGHALRSTGSLAIRVSDFAASGLTTSLSCSFNANGVDIAAGATLSVVSTGQDSLDFSMDYSGIKRGVLKVEAHGGADLNSLRLNAHFLGMAPRSGLFGEPLALRPSGVEPGDLTFGADHGDTNFQMLLTGPLGVALSGDIEGGVGHNTCLRTANVTAHNCLHDSVYVNPHMLAHNTQRLG